MKRRGNAIIIAMLMIAAVGGIAFGVGRLTIVDTANLATYENGMGAFYAAESGIEEGLLRYKYDRNYTVPFSEWVVGEDQNIFRTDLTLSSASEKIINSSASTIGSDQVYDLRMGYLGPDGIFAEENGDYFAVNQSDDIKIDLSKLTTDVNLSIIFKDISDGPTSAPGLTDEYCRAVAHIKLTVKDATSVKDYEDSLTYNPSLCESYTGLDPNKFLPVIGVPVFGDSSKLEINLDNVINTIGSRAGVANLGDSESVELSITPMVYDAEIKVSPVGASDPYHISNSVPSPYTKIISTGHYGGVARKITVNIDRDAGTVYDLFNYVIYKGQ